MNSTEVQNTTGKCSIEFQTDAISVLENAGKFGVTIVRRGESQTEARVQVTATSLMLLTRSSLRFISILMSKAQTSSGR